MLVQQNAGTASYAEDASMSAERAAQPAPGLRMGQIGQMFRRRIWLVVGVLVVLNGLALFAITKITPRYTAEATLIIGPRQAQVMDVKAVMVGIDRRHRRDRERAADAALAPDRPRCHGQAGAGPSGPSSTPNGLAGRQPTLREQIVAVVDTCACRSWPPCCRQPGAAPRRPSRAPARSSAIPWGPSTDAFLTRLYVAPKGRSRVIGVSVESADPALAAAAANAVADGYIENQLRSKLDATEHAHRWLDDRVREMREQVVNADQAVEAYRQKVGIMQGRTGTVLSEQSSELGTRRSCRRRSIAPPRKRG